MPTIRGADGYVNSDFHADGHVDLLFAHGWQSAVQHLCGRDRLIGWHAAQRARGLEHIVNNVRFLVLPWVKAPNLASVILSENFWLLQRDWRAHYGVAVWLAENPQRIPENERWLVLRNNSDYQIKDAFSNPPQPVRMHGLVLKATIIFHLVSHHSRR